MRVSPVNDVPSFLLLPTLVVSHGSGFRKTPAIRQLSAGPFEGPALNAEHKDATENQSLTFHIVDTTNEELFLIPPRLSGAGDLSFELAPFSTGYVEITTWLQDDGGTTSFTKSTEDSKRASCWSAFVSGAVDSGCTCAYNASMGGSSGKLTAGVGNCTWLLSSAADISFRFRDVDAHQMHRLVTTDRCATSDCLSGPKERLGRLAVADMPLTKYTTTRGLRFMRIHIEAGVYGGGLEAEWAISPVIAQSLDRSRAQVITLAVLADYHLPPSAAFSSSLYSQLLHCDSNQSLTTCHRSCDITRAQTDTGQTVRVQLMQDAGQVMIHAALSSTGAAGFLPETRVQSCVDSALPGKQPSHFTFGELDSDAVTSLQANGFEYASDYILTGSHAYAIEPHSDSVLTFGIDASGSKTKERHRILDRLSSGHVRSRLTKIAAAAEAANDICAWSAFDLDGDTIVASASGCLIQLEQYRAMVALQPGEYTTDAPIEVDAISQLASQSVGLWEFSTSSFEGAMKANPLPIGWRFKCEPPQPCVFTRPRETTLCSEQFETVIERAGVRDESNVLGAAVLVGPACKDKKRRDWDARKSPLSLSSFVVSDGYSEYLQFDGAQNSGLRVGFASDLVDGTHSGSRLPLGELSIEVAFIPSLSHVRAAGLVAVAQDGLGCGKGWSLTYSSLPAIEGNAASSTIRFALSVQANLQGKERASGGRLPDQGPGTFATLQHQIENGLPLDAWTHVIVTYNGSLIRLFLNGELVQEEPACSEPQCGDVVYPASYSQGDECCGESELTIGCYTNAKLGDRSMHVGVMSHVRITRVALSREHCAVLFASVQAKRTRHVNLNPFNQPDYWTAASQAVPRSPSFSLAHKQNDKLKIFGNFLTKVRYQVVFRDVKTGLLRPSIGLCDMHLGNSSVSEILCTVPEAHTYQTTILSLQKQALGHDSWAQVWSKVCYSPACGYLDYDDRIRYSLSHFIAADRLLRSDLTGALTIFCFVTPSVIFRQDSGTGKLERLIDLGSATMTVKGAASINAFQHVGAHLLFVCNFWDGQTFKVPSSLYRIRKQTLPPRYIAELVQEIDTTGARDSILLKIPSANMSVLAVANFGGDVVLHPLRDETDSPIDTSPHGLLELGLSSPTGLASFHMGQRLLLVVACFSSSQYPAPSALFEIVADSRESVEVSRNVYDEFVTTTIQWPKMAAHRVAQLDIHKVVDVQHLHLRGTDLLLFAVPGDEAVSLVYKVGGWESAELRLELIQQLPCSGASTLLVLASTPYLAVAEVGAVSIYRWNGTGLIAENTRHTVPKDSAGGQRLTQEYHVHALLAVTHYTDNATESNYLLLGVKVDEWSQHFLPRFNSSVWVAGQDHLSSMRGPSAFALSPDSLHLLVACSGSRSIVVFVRDAASGMLSFLPAAGFRSNFTSRNLDRNDARSRDNLPNTGEGITKQQLGYPLRGVSGIVVASDGLYVYTSSMTDNLVAVFSVDPSSHALHLVQVVGEQLNDDNRGDKFGLLGAASLALSASGHSLYVAGWRAHSLSVWQRKGSNVQECPGCLSFVHRLRQGERRPETFRNLPAVTSSSAPGNQGSPWSIGSHISSTATDGVSFFIQGQLFFAVALVAPNQGNNDGSHTSAVLLYRVRDNSLPQTEEKWAQDEEESELLTLVQQIPIRASTLCFFSQASQTSNAENRVLLGSFLVIGSGLLQSSSVMQTGQVFVFKWSQTNSKFQLEHELQHPRGAAGEVLDKVHPRSMHAFVTRSGHQLLAVAYMSSATHLQHPWCLYRWNEERVLAVSSNRFILERSTPSFGAIDIETTFHEGMQLLVVASKSVENSGLVDVFEVNEDGKSIALLQTIASEGVSDTSLVHVENSSGSGMLLLAVGIRQKGENGGPRVRPLSGYDQTSKIYRWAADMPQNSESAPFVLHQVLDGQDAPSVMQDFPVQEMQWADYQQALAQHLFCGFPDDSYLRHGKIGRDCRLGEDARSIILDQLRGVTGVDAFKANGETYLAVAQSVCEGEGECWAWPWDLPLPQPKSTVLQWNRRDARFGNMLAVTDESWVRLTGHRVPDEQLTENAFALRLSAGGARKFRYMEAGRRKLLLALSQSRGALVFEFGFGLVDGLRSVAAVAAPTMPLASVSQRAADAGQPVYTATGLDSAVSIFQHAPTFDGVGAIRGGCSGAACLRYTSTVRDSPRVIQSTGSLLSSQTTPEHRPLVRQGLLGARSIKVLPTASGCWKPSAGGLGPGSSCSLISIRGIRPRSNMLCSSVPPLPGAGAAADTAAGPAMTPPQCTDVDFRVERLKPLDSRQKTLEFTEEPSVIMSAWSTSVHDILMQVATASVGTARYRITPMSPAWLLTGPPLELDIQVEPINAAPSFEAFDIVVPQTVLPLLPGTSEVTVVFATSVSDGEPQHMPSQQLTWIFSSSQQEDVRIFSRMPSLHIVRSDDKEGPAGLQGVMTFQAGNVLRPGVADISLILCDDGPGADSRTGGRNCSHPALVRLHVRHINQVFVFFFWPNAAVLS
jgi:hypothetical protein